MIRQPHRLDQALDEPVIPTEASHGKCTPQGTKDAVLAAFRAGADGVILSRKYSEMKLANLGGAGQAVKQLGLG